MGTRDDGHVPKVRKALHRESQAGRRPSLAVFRKHSAPHAAQGTLRTGSRYPRSLALSRHSFLPCASEQQWAASLAGTKRASQVGSAHSRSGKGSGRRLPVAISEHRFEQYLVARRSTSDSPHVKQLSNARAARRLADRPAEPCRHDAEQYTGRRPRRPVASGVGPPQVRHLRATDSASSPAISTSDDSSCSVSTRSPS